MSTPPPPGSSPPGPRCPLIPGATPSPRPPLTLSPQWRGPARSAAPLPPPATPPRPIPPPAAPHAWPAYLVLLLAILSRFFPYTLHGIGLNVTAVPAALLFFGARRPRRELPLAAALLALTDAALTTLVFRLPFHPADYLVTWAWYLAAPLLGRTLLRTYAARPPARRLPRLATATLLSAGSFFLLSNGTFFLQTQLYPRTAAGLLACYAAGLPFLRNDLVSTLITTLAVFELPLLARDLQPAPTATPR